MQLTNGGSTAKTLRRFGMGGVVSEPTLGILGEEGPEIVARMKSSGGGSSSEGAKNLQQRIFLVDNRQDVPALTRNDVVLEVADNVMRGGDVGKAILHVVRLR